MSASHPQRSARSVWAQFAVLAVLFAALMARTWGKWPDSVVDFGRELYTPWRLSEGDVLYRDQAWFNGPLSPYWNALMFELFGVGLRTLVWVNAALFAAILVLLHAALRAFVAPWAATGACALVIACCGFAQLVGIGNYNYIAPYSHEATHGVLLVLGASVSSTRWAATRALGWAAACGACAGLAFLTKPEVFVAALVGGIGGLAFQAWNERVALATQLRALALFALGLAAPLLLAFAALSSSLGADLALRGVLGAWPSLASSDVAELAFYRRGMGLDAPAANALQLVIWTARWAALVGALAALGFALRKLPAPAWVKGTLALLAGGALTYGLFVLARLSEAARPWPLLVALVLGASLVALVRHASRSAAAARATFALTALLLLGKMALNVRISHYGFALAMPATALLAALALDALGRFGARFDGETVLRAAAAGVLIVFGALHVVATERIHRIKQEPLGSGVDEFRADVRGTILNAVLGWLERSSSPDQPARTLAVFPEGVTLNYLARLENPTPYINFMPPEIVLFGEERILAAFQAAPPDVVVITHKDTSEYGYKFFGVDYARQLGAWLRAEYRAVQVFGDPPLQPQSRFGAAVLVRNR